MMTEHEPPIVRTSSDLPSDHWMAQQLPADTSLRGYAEDRAVSLLTRAAIEAIEDAGLSRAEVARVLGTTKSYVSQVLNGSTNMTLKTLGALFWVAGREVDELRTAVMGGVKPQETRTATATTIAVVSTVSAPNFNTTCTIEVGPPQFISQETVNTGGRLLALVA
jgi:predicted XRE-type DNA-binding protein